MTDCRWIYIVCDEPKQNVRQKCDMKMSEYMSSRMSNMLSNCVRTCQNESLHRSIYIYIHIHADPKLCNYDNYEFNHSDFNLHVESRAIILVGLYLSTCHRFVPLNENITTCHSKPREGKLIWTIIHWYAVE